MSKCEIGAFVQMEKSHYLAAVYSADTDITIQALTSVQLVFRGEYCDILSAACSGPH